MPRLYLAGRRGSGKSTAASILRCRYGAGVGSMSSVLRQFLRSFCLPFGVHPDRALLQRIGDAFRLVDPHLLVMHAAWDAEVRADGELAVVDGVRLPGEAEWLNARGWVGVLIEASPETRAARRAPEPESVDEHPTESNVDGLPVLFRVRNDGTVEELEWSLGLVLSLAARANEICRAGSALRPPTPGVEVTEHVEDG